MSGNAERFDVIISGASFAGLALALGLVRSTGGGLRIALIERRPALCGTPPRDERAFALSAGAVYMLDALSVWAALKEQAQPVTTIKITDSELDAGVRLVLLTYDNRLPGGDAAAFIVPASPLLEALERRVASEPSITMFFGRDIESHESTAATARICLDGATVLMAPLAVAADGGRSRLRELAGVAVVRWSHDQRGIVTTIAHSKPHGATAIQHFLPGGPFAILPLPGGRSCITWSEDEAVAARMLELSDEDFLAEVERRVGGKLGTLTLAGGRQSWPLATHMARSFIAPRVAIVADAAHGVHPIAGQGLNLGFRDVAALIDVVVDAARLGLDIGAANVLERYERWRRYDSTVSAAVFDGLNRLFSKDWALLRSAREFGLGSVDRIEVLKEFFVTEAASQSGEVPRLMQKQAV